MKVVLAFLLFSAVLAFSPAAHAADLAPVTPIYTVSGIPGPGPGFYAGFIERLARFETLGWLSFTHLRLYTFHDESSGAPGPGPGLYLGVPGDAALAARLSISDADKWSDKGALGERAGSPLKFFVAPEFREAFDHVRRVMGMPVIDNADARLNSDYGVRYGLTWRFR